ncbi:MAG: serine/threonine protein kinase [Deltaproteobacteria bacterium]|nr:MAG: serine/threonine protein kinase [Deltaproteobacteria bacterium]
MDPSEQGALAEGAMLWDGRYRIVRTLGEGGMGRVLLAHDLARDDRPVALKILLPDFFDALTEFLHEYVLQRGLSHPHLPRAYELGFANEPEATYPYFAMEYCRGVPLLSAMRRASAPRMIFEVMSGLLRALDHMHGQGLVHGDIKPSNVLVSSVGEGSFAWLIDLGVAGPIGGYTDADVFVGTPEYAAPELLTGVGVDQRADLYAVGLILYELIQKRRPWPGSDETQLLLARRAGPPPPISAKDCPPALAELVTRSLDPDPARRPPNAATFLLELCEAMGVEAELEPPGAFARRLAVLPHPAEGATRPAATALLAGLKPQDQTEEVPLGLLLEGPVSLDGSRLLHHIGDRAALLGARVLRISLHTPTQLPLSALETILGVLLRLHPELAPSYEKNPTPVGAARVLDGSGRPLLLVVDGLQRADAESLTAISAVLARSQTHVRLLATLHPEEEQVAPAQLARLVNQRGVGRAVLAELVNGRVGDWLDVAVGPGALHEADREALIHDAAGSTLGLVHGLHDLYRRGRIVRTPQGYAPGAAASQDAPVTHLDPTGRVDELDALLACVHAPLGERALKRYLGTHADIIPALIGHAVLVQRDDGTLMVADETRRAAIYERVPLLRRQRLHRRLAVALEETRSKDHERTAFEYQRSETPLLAVPHLITAARHAPEEGRPGAARRLIDAARILLEDHHEEDRTTLDLWRFWSLLLRADAHVSLTIGDLEHFEEVVEKLFQLGTDMAHRQTLQAALEFRLLVDERQRDWNRLVEDAGALLSLDPEGPPPDSLARFRWAKALRDRADGLPALAAEHLERGLESRNVLSNEVQLLLLYARASLFVDMSWHAQADPAVDDLYQTALAVGRPVDLIRARVLRARLLRHRGFPASALLEARQLLRDLEGERSPGLDAVVEWELASCHIEFGWFSSARDHARQAQAMATADHDGAQRVRALLVEATALQAMGARELAWTTALQASRLIPSDDASAAVNARLVTLELALDSSGFRQLEEVAREASEIGWRAQRRQEGARAARAFDIAARAAVQRKDPQLALQWETLALKAIDRFAPSHIHRARHLATLADAQALAGKAALALETRAQARAVVAQVAGTITDKELRVAWLDNPVHRAIIGVTPVAEPTRAHHRTHARRRVAQQLPDLPVPPAELAEKS